jgi:hypothetical protein
MTEIADLDTPCVVIDLVKVEAKLKRAHSDTGPVAACGRSD